MERLRKWEWLLISLTFAFLTFLAGYFLGQNREGRLDLSGGSAFVETERGGAYSPEPVLEESAAQPLPSPDAAAGLVNINSAGKEALMSLPGIGEALAERIIAYRQENGPFVAKDALMDVPGIGEGKYAACKDLITI